MYTGTPGWGPTAEYLRVTFADYNFVRWPRAKSTHPERGQTVGTGHADAKRYAHKLRNMIIQGRATPSLAGSQELPLSQAAEAYALRQARGMLHPGID